MDYHNAVSILTNPTLILPASSDLPIREAAKCAFIDDYDRIEETYPDIEEKIAQVKGLMSELFSYKRKRRSNSSQRKRKGSVIGDDS